MNRWWLLLCCLAFAVRAETFEAPVIAVIDGDTVLVLRDRQKIKVRLTGIDAPEKQQPYGKRSRRSLCQLVCRRAVRVEQRAVDQYQRALATLYADGLDVNREQVRRGMAWENSFHHSDRELVAIQREAQQARRGLWADAGPQPPWVWRREHSMDTRRQAIP